MDGGAKNAVSGPELFFALVYPVGTDSDAVASSLTDALSGVGYQTTELHLIDLLLGEARDENVFERYMSRMNRGNELRKDFGKEDRRQDAFALYGAAAVLHDRLKRHPSVKPEERLTLRHAYILRSLKRPEEVVALRQIYGDALIVIAAHSSRQTRSDRLTWEVAKSEVQGGTPDSYRPEAEKLITRDEREAGEQFGQRVSDTFPLADVFVDASHPARLTASVSRFVDLLFGYPFHTPTRDEYAMFHAQGAALRSSDLSRQVGAAITNEDGEVIALGTNDVPRGGGGLYWPEDGEEDRRDFTHRYDISSEIKKRAIRQVVDRLQTGGWLRETVPSPEDVWEAIQGTDLMNVGEFGRAVHAEMAAIVDAARRGASIRGCSLHTTTFPCHVCARHIVAAGIERVVYVEPYPKSLASYLHLDSIAVDEKAVGAKQVAFEPFVGVAPHLYVRLFKMNDQYSRKDREGRVLSWDKPHARPRLFGVPSLYIRQESGAFQVLAERLGEERLNLSQ